VAVAEPMLVGSIGQGLAVLPRPSLEEAARLSLGG
jgi:hypothetical protein